MTRLLAKRFLLAAAFASLSISLAACGGSIKKDYSAYFWPPAPDKKRVQLLNIIQSETDIGEISTLDMLIGEGGFRSFTKPHDVAYDEVTDTLFVSDTGGGGVIALDFKNHTTRAITEGYGLLQPFGIAVDSKNRILAITHKDKVVLISLENMVPQLTIGSKGEFQNAIGIALDPQRKFIYVSDAKSHRVYKFSYGGEMLATIAEKGQNDGQVAFPAGMDVDAEGNLYVVDTGHFRILVFGPDGKFLRKWGSHGSAIGEFGRPKDIAISKDGVALVTEADFQFVVLFNKTGETLMAFGGPGFQPDQFVTPSGIAIDSKNRFYVVDQNNRRIKVFQLLTDEEYERSFQQPAGTPASEPASGQPSAK